MQQAGPLSDEGASGNDPARHAWKGNLTCEQESSLHRDPGERKALQGSHEPAHHGPVLEEVRLLPCGSGNRQHEGEGPLPHPVAVKGVPVAGLLTQSALAEKVYTAASARQSRANARPQIQ
ncbi:hypothetical protein NDU88_009424 [Pleurodeles waltl]|uniref:Uncharacterized protein n=1 Tax=Pleurodeles waltl TaxID=8319 RepID=A0AAV7RW29_PLEWA|nr:hypothetical protein NDU88_009424 [Pleurodeles waltl]